MRGSQFGKTVDRRRSNQLLWLAGILGATLAVLFYKGFGPHQVLFANDLPLGAEMADDNHLPSRLFGRWINTTWLGMDAPSAAPTISIIMATIFPPTFYMKIYGPFTMLFLGFSAWVFFRQQGFNSKVCVLGGIAAGLNMHFFSTACWGLGNWNMSASMIFLALAALTSKSIKQIWAKAILAGLAVGMNLMEGFDVGAILSVYVGIFVIFRALSEETGFAQKIITAAWTELLVVFFSAFIGAHTISSLVQTQVEGIVTAQQDEATRGKVWNRDTQWSLPKKETLRLVTPGLFGYRMVQYITTRDKSGAYWGSVGEDPRIPQLKSQNPEVRSNGLAHLDPPAYPDEIAGLQSDDAPTRIAAAEKIRQRMGLFVRHDGTGEYAGILVAMLALFAVANACRGVGSPFSAAEKRVVWFWAAAAVFSIMAAWGRHGFVYGLLYKLPYVSTIRNPIKFLHPFHIICLILFGFGLEILNRRYLQNMAGRTLFLPEHLKLWWSKAVGFEKGWALASGLAVVVSIVGVFILFRYQTHLIAYLEAHNFKSDLAPAMAAFCCREGVWSAVFLALSVVTVATILSGAWAGPRANWAWILMGAVLIADLGRSDAPWVHFYNYEEKYSSNPVTDFLLQRKPYEQRVIGRLSPRGAGSANGQGFGQIYNFWMQNDFPSHNIETLDFAQMSRTPFIDDEYLRNFRLVGTNARTADLRPAARMWELTDTRYILADAAGIDTLNEHADPTGHGFRLVARLSTRQKDGIQTPEDPGDLTVQVDAKGSVGLIEYDRALPRAKLYASWETPTNGPETLAMLLSQSFDPQKTVLLWTNPPVAQSKGDPGADPGTVEITDYHPKYIKLKAEAKTPAVLLLNDKFHPDWKVWVDRKPAPLLRCNYIMRGVFLDPGEHTVEFRFKTSLTALYLSLAGWGVGLLVAGFLLVNRKGGQKQSPVANPAAPRPTPTPARPPLPAPPAKPSEPKGRQKPPKRRK